VNHSGCFTTKTLSAPRNTKVFSRQSAVALSSISVNHSGSFTTQTLSAPRNTKVFSRQWAVAVGSQRHESLRKFTTETRRARRSTEMSEGRRQERSRWAVITFLSPSLRSRSQSRSTDITCASRSLRSELTPIVNCKFCNCKSLKILIASLCVPMCHYV
jgi:hypothetical protein